MTDRRTDRQTDQATDRRTLGDHRGSFSSNNWLLSDASSQTFVKSISFNVSSKSFMKKETAQINMLFTGLFTHYAHSRSFFIHILRIICRFYPDMRRFSNAEMLPFRIPHIMRGNFIHKLINSFSTQIFVNRFFQFKISLAVLLHMYVTGHIKSDGS